MAEQLKLEQQHGQVDWGQQGVIMSGPLKDREKEREKERIRESTLKFTQDTE
jgi:hypothetical protein